MARTPYPRSDHDLIARISRSAGGRAGYKQLIRELGLGGGRERRLLVEQLTRMVARGELVRAGEDMWSIPKREPIANQPFETSRLSSKPAGRCDGMEAAVRSGRDRLVSGRLDLHRDGFGFVRPDASASQKRVKGEVGKAERGGSGGQSQEDIFIPPNEMNGAMQGDLVLVD